LVIDFKKHFRKSKIGNATEEVRLEQATNETDERNWKETLLFEEMYVVDFDFVGSTDILRVAALKKQLLDEKMEKLKADNRLDKFINKKQKRSDQKEKKKMPKRRRVEFDE
jgi:hypothetical protein